MKFVDTEKMRVPGCIYCYKINIKEHVITSNLFSYAIVAKESIVKGHVIVCLILHKYELPYKGHDKKAFECLVEELKVALTQAYKCKNILEIPYMGNEDHIRVHLVPQDDQESLTIQSCKEFIEGHEDTLSLTSEQIDLEIDLIKSNLPGLQINGHQKTTC